MRLRTCLAVLSLFGLAAGCAGPMPQAARSELAPTGSLRVGLNASNTSLSVRSPGGGEPRGVAVDIARELGRRAGVPVKLISFDSGGELAASIRTGQWDVAFFAIEPARAGQVDFSPPYVEIETTYLVRSDSPLRTVADVDTNAVSVAVPRGAGYESALAKLLQRATLVRAGGFSQSIRLLDERKVDAVAFLKPTLIEFAEGRPGVRVLEGRFASVQQAIGVQKGREAARRYLESFVADLVRSGFVAKSVADNGVRGLAIVK